MECENGRLSRIAEKLKIRDKASNFFKFKTRTVEVVPSKAVGIIFRLLQLAIVVYFVGWVFIYEKGYQSQSDLVSSVNIKLKGVASVDVYNLDPHLQLLDEADYVFPSQGANSFVVMTNFIVTPNQKNETCAAHPTVDNKCRNDEECMRGQPSKDSKGVMTGRCIRYNKVIKTCEVVAWCPLENETIPSPPLILSAENFTLLIKISAYFPKFSLARSNVDKHKTLDNLANCTYNNITDPRCPRFPLGYMVSRAGESFENMSSQGGIIGIHVHWQCDLDYEDKHCTPSYNFTRLDFKNTPVSRGFNFRYAKYYKEDNVTSRDLYQVFGIRFEVLVYGKAGKFDIIPTLIAIGSGAGLFSVATAICNFMYPFITLERKETKNGKTAQQEKKEDVAGSNVQGDNEENMTPESTSTEDV